LRYAEFVVPLVKAVQELSQQNDELKNQNKDLQKRIEKLEAIMNVQSTTSYSQSPVDKRQTANLSNASLEQNTPNPFRNNTIIRYYLPSNTNNAQIIINDVSGHILKTIVLTDKGAGNLSVNTGELAAGNYMYSLFVDGKKVDTRQMIITG